MQTLFFLEERRKRLPDLRDVVIVFATPVYLWNVPIASKMDELKQEQQRREIIRSDYAKAQVSLTEAWNSRPLRVGAKQDLLQNIKKSYGIELEDEFDKKAIAYLRTGEMVQNAINDMIAAYKKQQADKDGKGKKSAEQIEEFENYMNNTMAPLFVHEQELRRSVQVSTKTISKLNAELKDLLNEGIPTPGGRDFFRAKPWPDGLKLVNGMVVFEQDDLWWKAPKSVLGETTTLKEKIRAFEHWVHIALSSNPRLKILEVGNVTHPFNPDLSACQEVSKDLGVGLEGRLLHPRTVLQCVYDQWSKLQVFVDAMDNKTILQIRGKAVNDDEEAGGSVARDDLWMAFSIGMQWCSRFTCLLPNSAMREQLVKYMDDVRVLVGRAIQQCLRDAALIEDSLTDNQVLDVPTMTNTQPLVHIPAPAFMDSLVVVGAIINAILKQCQGMRDLIRKLIMSCAVNKLRPPGGFHIKARMVMRERNMGQENLYWKEQYRIQLQEENPDMDLDKASNIFGMVSSTIRITNAAPYSQVRSWPSTHESISNGTVDVIMENIAKNLINLDMLLLPALQIHAMHHPILKNTGAQKFPILVLHRLRSLYVSIQSVIGDLAEQVVKTHDSFAMTELSQIYFEMTKPEPSNPFMPIGLLTAYVELTEELVFLRKLQTHNRRHLVEVLQQIPNKVWECSEISRENDMSIPRPVAKLFQRRLVKWKSVFQKMWPY